MKEGHEILNPIHESMKERMDPEFVKFYNKYLGNAPAGGPIDLKALRKNYSTIYAYGTAPAPEIKNVKDLKFPSFDGEEIVLRVYRPDGAEDEILPVHLDFHGGGWGLGDLDTESHILKHYTHDAKVVVIDVEYRLVPEYPYPTGLKDCFEAVKYVYNNPEVFKINKNSISVGGVSAGANIALALNHLCRDIGIDFVLVCAGTPQAADIEHIEKASDSKYESMSECEFAPTLNWARLKWFDSLKWESLSKDPKTREQQLKEIGWFRDIMTAPNFYGLSKTLIFTSGCDPMRSEGEAYAKKLIDHGNEVIFKRYPGVPHTFMHMDSALWQARSFRELTAREIAFAHGTSSS